jgi:hypothetical protein
MGIPRRHNSHSKKRETRPKRRLKPGDIVLAKSPAGDIIPACHVKLVKRIEVKPSKGNRMDWPGYVGWEGEMVLQEEVDLLRKHHSIPFEAVGDETFVYEDLIVKKVRNLDTIKKKQDKKETVHKKKSRRRIVRNKPS